MTIQVELAPEAEARLAATAQAHGVALEQYVETLLHEVLASSPAGSEKLSVDELDSILREMAEGSERLPRVPTPAFTRESFYEGRL